MAEPPEHSSHKMSEGRDGARRHHSGDAPTVRAVQLDQRTLEFIVTWVTKQLLQSGKLRGMPEPGVAETGAGGMPAEAEGTSTVAGTAPPGPVRVQREHEGAPTGSRGRPETEDPHRRSHGGPNRGENNLKRVSRRG